MTAASPSSLSTGTSVPLVILNLGSRAQKRPGRARLCYTSKESWDTTEYTEKLLSALCEGAALAPCPRPRNRPPSERAPEARTAAHRHIVCGTVHTRVTTIPCVLNSWVSPREDPTQTRPFVKRYSLHPFPQEKCYFPLAIHPGPRLTHFPSCPKLLRRLKTMAPQGHLQHTSTKEEDSGLRECSNICWESRPGSCAGGWHRAQPGLSVLSLIRFIQNIHFASLKR